LSDLGYLTVRVSCKGDFAESAIRRDVMPMQKGDTILRSALIGGLQLELAYRDPSVPERSNELRKPNQKRAKAGLSTVLLDTTHGEVRE
jgi:hypothetical protein